MQTPPLTDDDSDSEYATFVDSVPLPNSAIIPTGTPATEKPSTIKPTGSMLDVPLLDSLRSTVTSLLGSGTAQARALYGSLLRDTGALPLPYKLALAVVAGLVVWVVATAVLGTMTTVLALTVAVSIFYQLRTTVGTTAVQKKS